MSRETLLIIGVIIIAVIFLDGLRRMYKARRAQVRLSPELKKQRREPKDESSADYYSDELPTGKSRVITGSQEEADQLNSAEELFAIKDEAFASHSETEAPPLQLTMLEPGDLIAQKSGKKLSKLSKKVGKTAPQQKVKMPEVIAINVMSLQKDRGLLGTQLLPFLNKMGLHYGEMNIFHYHEVPHQIATPVLFSMANAIKPGTFDYDQMQSFATPGVTFFMQIEGIKKLLAFSKMLEIARKLAAELGGEVKDEERNPLTSQTVEHYRQRIRDHERRYRTQESQSLVD